MTNPLEDDLFAPSEGGPYILVDTGDPEVKTIVHEIAEKTDRHVDIPECGAAIIRLITGRIEKGAHATRAPYAFLIARDTGIGAIIGTARTFGRLAMREKSIAVVLPATPDAREALQRSINHHNIAYSDPIDPSLDILAGEKLTDAELRHPSYVRMEDLVVIDPATGDLREQLEQWMAGLPTESSL